MPLETRNEIFSVIGIDLPFVHGFPDSPTNPLSQSDLQAIIHKSSAILFSAAAVVAAIARRFYVAATNKSKWNRTGFGLGPG